MKRLFLFITLLGVNGFIFSQEFRQAAGIRAGYTGGIEYRIYTDELNSYKFLLGARQDGALFHVMKEFHRYDLFDFSDRLSFVYGAGLHVGYERWDHRFFNFNKSYFATRTSFIAGLDGLAGVEYMFHEVPVSLGFEVKPFFDLFGRHMFDVGLFDFAFTIKYHF